MQRLHSYDGEPVQEVGHVGLEAVAVLVVCGVLLWIVVLLGGVADIFLPFKYILSLLTTPRLRLILTL